MAACIGMSAAVSLLMLFCAGVTSVIPLSALCLFTASLMTWIPIREEHGYIFAAVEFVLVCAAALIICRGIFTYLYTALFGHYAFVRLFLRSRIKDRFLTVLLRLLWFNLLTAAALAVAQYLLHYEVMTLIPNVNVFIVIAVIEGSFIVFMLLYSFFAYLFDSSVRNKLLPRR